MTILAMALSALGFALVVPAACGAEVVEVNTVRFALAHPVNNTAASWLEATVVLNVAPPANAPGHMVSRVRVLLAVSWESPALAGGSPRTEYYRSEVECVALPAGRSDVRFYFPPELVKRDHLQGSPRVWAVELAVEGRTLQPARGATAIALGEAAARRAYLSAVAIGAVANEGLLQPQYLTPFLLEYPRTTVTCVRREPSQAPAARLTP